MGHRVFGSPALYLALAVWLAPAAPARAAEELVDGIAAQVGGDVVLVSEVLRLVADPERRMREAGMPESEIAKLRAEGLEQMIEERLLEQVVKQFEFFASDAEIDETIEAIALENGISLDQLRDSVRAAGLEFEQYRLQIKRKLERQKVMGAMVASQVEVEDGDVERLYAERFGDQPTGGSQLHLRQILVTPTGAEKLDMQRACVTAGLARSRVEQGEAFEAVASEVSEVAPQHGGDIGWLHSRNLASWMSDVVATLEPGQTSDVVALPFGCTLLKLVERREFEPISFEQAKPMLEQQVFERQLQTAFRDWMEDLRERTFIERRGYFADAARLGAEPPGAAQQALEQPLLQ